MTDDTEAKIRSVLTDCLPDGHGWILLIAPNSVKGEAPKVSVLEVLSSSPMNVVKDTLRVIASEIL